MAENKKSGFLNGLGYLGEKVGAGFMQSIEGIWDFAASGIADIFGNEEYAKRQMENDWFGDWYNTAGDWFDATGGWKVAGDVANALGTSLPSIVAGVGIGLLTGGAAAPLALKIMASSITVGVAGLSAAGTSTKEAFRETGKLTSEEYGYGALSGALEAGIELATGKIGTGSARIAKSIVGGATKTAAQEAAEELAKKSIKQVAFKAAKNAGKDFVSEGVEEGLTELISPYLQKITYDPSAENATAEEVAYAALVGGLSGAIMSPAGDAIAAGANKIADAHTGAQAIADGQEQEILSLARDISNQVEGKEAGYEVLAAVDVVYKQLAESVGSGKVTTLQQKALLGRLKKLLSASYVLPSVEASAKNLVTNPQATIEKYTQLGLTDENGNPITVEKLTEGLEFDENGRVSVASLRKAISQNRVLGTLAIAEAMGRLMVDHETYLSNATRGGYLGGRAQYQHFLENASPEQKAAMARLIGAENLDAVDYETFAKRMIEYGNSDEGSAKIRSARDIRETAENIPENERAIPHAVSTAMEDGVHRFGGKEGVAIFKNGDTVRIYDYETRNTTRELTIEEASAELRKARRALTETKSKTKVPETETKSNENATKTDETSTKPKKTTDDIDAYAKENVNGYEDLLPAERREIRAMIRQAKALGIPDADIKMYARVAARSGIRISFSKDLNAYTKTDGTTGYSDGFYDPKSNTIVVNPEGKRSAGKLLMHELSHALYSYKKYRAVLDKATRRMDEARAERIAKSYRDAGETAEVISEELAVHHAEDVLGSKANLERVVEEEPNIKSKILSFFRVAKTAYGDDSRLSLNAGRLYKHFEKAFNDFAARNKRNLAADTTPMAMRESMDDARFSLQFADNIAEGQRAYLASHRGVIEDSELSKAIEDTAKMVKKMLPHKDILPTDAVGKKGATLVKNGSYDVSVENTTVCIRTLSYNAFTDMVSEKIGRPLSQMESFLVSQKLYDIAKEPQCLYCYVSLDRKAFNEMIIRYTEQRDAAVKAWEDAGKPSVSRSSELYEKFRAGRKDTDNMWKRYNEWIEAAKSGEKLITLADVATESRRAEIAKNGTASQKTQIADMLKYAQSASWAKKQTKYVAYYDDILRLSPKAVKDLNKHYGLRWYSFSDYSGAFIVENMQQVTDASLRGLKGLSYTKDVDFARIFAPTGMNINISVYATDINGKWEIDPKQSADIDAAIKLREKYPNVGIVVVAAKRSGVEWALAQEWSDVVIPFHIVRSGQDVANFYDWEVFNSEQGDTVMDENLWAQYVESLGNPKKVSKSIYPSEHQNSRATYLALCEERGIKPRFSSFLDNPNYMKLVNETRQREADTMPLRPTFDLGAAEKSFDRFVEKGGYYEGWYNDGVDISAEVDTVAADVLAGKKANEVEYGRQDRNGNAIPTPDELMASRKANRSHGRRMALCEFDDGQRFVSVETDQSSFDGLSQKEQTDLATKIIKSRFKGKVIGVDNKTFVNGVTANEYTHPSKHLGPAEYEAKMRASAELDNLMDAGFNFTNEADGKDGHVHPNVVGGFDYFDVIFLVSSEYYRGVINIENNARGKRLKDITKIENITKDVVSRYGANPSYTFLRDVSMISIPDSSEKINPSDEKIRRALPDTTEAIGKARKEYKPSKKESFYTAKDRAYIEAVDELYGISKYLRKFGGLDKDFVDGLVQFARASISQAQTMIGTAQYDLFGDKPEKVGEGLLEIYKPTRLWSKEKAIQFDDYLLHQLNIDRMTLESRSVAWTAAERAQIAKVKGDIKTLSDGMKTLRAGIKKAENDIVNARVREGKAVFPTTKKKWQAAADAAKKRKKTLEASLKQSQKDTAAKIKELEKLRAELKELELKNKPVFGKDETLDENGNMKRDHDITAEESRKIVSDYEKKYPEFVEIAEKIYAYLGNNQKSRVKAGLITQDSADYMKKLYPHYVPSYRDVQGGGIAVVRGKHNIELSTTIRKAKGGNQDILEIASSIAEQTSEVIKAANIHRLTVEIYEAAKRSGDTTWVEILSEETVSDQPDNEVERPKSGQITFYHDGKKIVMSVAKEIELGFEALHTPTVDFTNPLAKFSAAVTSVFKRLVTSLNPGFMIRNPIKDVQDAGLNSKHPVLFAKELGNLWLLWNNDILKNSETWELYRALGGFSSTVFDGKLSKRAGYAGFAPLSLDTDADGLKKAFAKGGKAFKALFTSVENANVFLEQMTRFAEFKASLAAGDSPMVALNNSAEVTTNFGRRGNTTKKFNATLIPFLNAAIQGFDKIFRNVGDAFRKKMIRGITVLLTRAAIIGVAPMLLNAIMYDDDEDYEKLREEDKENYFLIKVGDGNFIKIPRGRLAGVIGGAANRIRKASNGEDADLGGYIENVKTQITPAENLSRTIFSPIFDVKNNKTWYGGEIEGQEFDAVAPRDRYDESTSSIAVAIGSVIPNGWNMSPKKIHYLLDQYSGVVGDFVLPATSQKEHKDFFSGNFTLDSVTNNKLSEKFYDIYDETKYADTAGDVNASYRLKYMNRVKKSIRELNREIETVRAENIDNKEKMAKVRVIRALINAEYDSALKSISTVDAAIAATVGIDDEDLRDAEITRRVFGAEAALQNYNAKSFEKYALFNKAGVGFDELYAFHFATLGIENDLDKKGNPIEGSKRKKVVAIINALNIPREQKIMLMLAKGYAVKDGDIQGVSGDRAKKMLLSYIMKQKITKEEKAELAKACGFTVKNGVIVNK